MKQKTNRRRLKRALSGVLTGAMLLSQLSLGTALAASVEAPDKVADYLSPLGISGSYDLNHPLNLGDNSAIFLDTGYGPAVDVGTAGTHMYLCPGGQATAVDANISGYKAIGTLIKSTAGTKLNAVITGGTAGTDTPPSLGIPVPNLPWNTSNAPAWDGMKFQAWQKLSISKNTMSTVTSYEVPVFPYQPLEVYRAVWMGDSAHKKELRVVHFFDKDGTASGSFETAASGAEPANMHRFAFSKTEQIPKQDHISKEALTPPGYELDSIILKNNKFVRPDGATEIDEGIVEPSPQTDPKSVDGPMPNRDAAIGFKYKRNSQTFTLTARYRLDDGSTLADGGNVATPIADSQVTGKAPDEEVDIPLADESHFLVDGSGNKQYIFHQIDTAPAQNDSGLVFPGSFNANKWKMGNQNVVINCVYKVNPAFKANVRIKYLVKNADGTTEPVPAPGGSGTIADDLKDLTPGVETEVTLPNVPAGYKTGTISDVAVDTSSNPASYHFNSAYFSDAGSSVAPLAPAKLKINPTVHGGILTVYYTPDTSSSSFTKVKLFVHPNGSSASISGNQEKNFPNSSSMTMRKLLSEVSGVAEGSVESGLITMSSTDAPYYELKGWFKATSSGALAPGATQIGMDDVIGGFDSTERDYVAEVVKKQSAWLDIEFKKGSGDGSVSATGSGRLSYKGNNQLPAYDAAGVTTTTLSHLLDPTSMITVTPGTGYSIAESRGAGWFNSAGIQVAHYDDSGVLHIDATDALTASDTFTFNFAPNIVDDGYNHTPSAVGKLDSSTGTGTITVQAPNAKRAYVVVDENGNVVDNKSGTALSSGDFTGLTPGSPYKVYEVPSSELHNYDTHGVPYVDTLVHPAPPCDVVIPAIGTNFNTSDGADNTRTLVVNPTAPNTEYALVDENGRVVPVDGSSDGFVNPNGGPATFRNLDPNTNYTVVARPVGSSDPATNRVPYGTNVNTGNLSSGTTTGTLYDLYVEDPGKVSSYMRGGNTVTVTTVEYQHIRLQAGDQVMINAANTNANGENFKSWNILLGNPGNFTGTRSSSFTMPAETVRLAPVYESPIATSSTLPNLPGNPQPPAGMFNVDFAPKNGEFGVSSKSLHDLLVGDLITTDDLNDIQALSDKINYSILLEKKAGPNAAMKPLVEGAVTNSDNLEYAWAMRVRLRRTRVPGSSRDVTAERKNLVIGTVYGAIPANLLANGASNLELVEVDADDNVNNLTTAGLSIDPATGQVEIPNAKVGATYVLTYKRSYSVTIANASGDSADAPGLPQTINDVARGEALSMSNAFNALLAASIPEKLDNERYIRKGFSKSATSYQAYELSNPLNGEKTLYVWYEENPDWNKAHTDLKGGIDKAQDLLNGGKLTADQQAQLQDALNDALAVFNKNNPSATIAEQEAALARLKALIDSFTGGGGVTPGPNPNTPDRHRGGGGGGGGGGSYSGGSRITASAIQDNNAYRVGIDGDWINIDPANHKWEFQLKNKTLLRGTWANLSYTFDGKTVIYRYHFADDAIMDSGWFKDVDDTWYFLCTTHDGWFGRAMMGWHHDESDGRWYYLNTVTGAMQINWQFVNGRWYFLNPDTPRTTWSYDHNLQKWVYNNPENARPYGSLYMGERTPDNHDVDRDGAWIQMRP